MGLRNTRLWVASIALAFLVLWGISISSAYKNPQQDPLPETVPSYSEKVGIAGWCLVGIGCCSVAVTGYLCCRPKRRKKPVRSFGTSGRPHRSQNPIYSPTPAHRYQYTAQRRR